jgi:hypothetical protein
MSVVALLFAPELFKTLPAIAIAMVYGFVQLALQTAAFVFYLLRIQGNGLKLKPHNHVILTTALGSILLGTLVPKPSPFKRI